MSAVVGVILMVAITVVLSAALFVMVGQLGQEAQVAPKTQWKMERDQSGATLMSADHGAQWSDFDIRYGSGRSGTVTVGSVDHAIQAGQATQLTAAPLRGGETLRFCVDGGGPLTATLRHIDANAMTHEFVFPHAAAC